MVKVHFCIGLNTCSCTICWKNYSFFNELHWHFCQKSIFFSLFFWFVFHSNTWQVTFWLHILSSCIDSPTCHSALIWLWPSLLTRWQIFSGIFQIWPNSCLSPKLQPTLLQPPLPGLCAQHLGPAAAHSLGAVRVLEGKGCRWAQLRAQGTLAQRTFPASYSGNPDMGAQRTSPHSKWPSQDLPGHGGPIKSRNKILQTKCWWITWTREMQSLADQCFPIRKENLIKHPFSRTALWSPCILIWFRGRRTTVVISAYQPSRLINKTWKKPWGDFFTLFRLRWQSGRLGEWVKFVERHHSVSIRVDPGDVGLSRGCATYLPDCSCWTLKAVCKKDFWKGFVLNSVKRGHGTEHPNQR